MRTGYIEVALNFLKYIEKEDLLEVVLSEMKDINGGIPTFFYAYPFFNNVEQMVKGGYQESGKNYKIWINELLDYQYLNLLEYLFIKKEKKRNCLIGQIYYEDIYKVFGYSEYVMKQKFRKMAHLTITMEYNHKEGSFSIFDDIIFDDRGEKITYSFSKTTSFLYAIVPHFPIKDYFEDFKKYDFNKNNIFIKFLLSYFYPLSDGIALTTLYKSMFGNSGATVLDSYKIVSFLEQNKKILNSIGLFACKIGKNSVDAVCFDKEKCPKFLNYKKEYVVAVGRKNFNYFIEEMESVLDLKKKKVSKEMTPAISSFAPIEEIEFKNAFAEYPKKLNIQEDIAQIEFRKFKNYFKNQPARKSWIRSWQYWIRKAITSSVENIEYNDEYRKYAINNGLREEDAQIEFRKFKNYYKTSKKATKDDWLPMWDNWTINAVEFRKNKSSNKTMQNIQTNFFLANLVNEEIRSMFQREGVNPTDIIHGKVKAHNVGFSSVPVPPKGTSRATLFYWKDPEKQNKEIDKYRQ